MCHWSITEVDQREIAKGCSGRMVERVRPRERRQQESLEELAPTHPAQYPANTLPSRPAHRLHVKYARSRLVTNCNAIDLRLTVGDGAQ